MFVKNHTIKTFCFIRIYTVRQNKGDDPKGGYKMKTTSLKRTICTALAGLMLAMTACGNVSDKPDDESKAPVVTKTEPASTSEEDIPSPDTAMSAKALSSEQLAPSEAQPGADFYDSYREYAAALFRQSCTDDIRDGKNVMVSPESVMMALGMTANGANGETLEQMQKALGGISIEDINTAMQYRLNKYSQDNNVRFNAANSVWVRSDERGVNIRQDFFDKVKKIYNADTFNVPFDEAALSDINSWVNDNTNKMIPAILDEFDPQAVAYLINAIAFEAEWEEKYEEDHKDFFTNSRGEEEEVRMMYSTENGYFEDKDTKGFIKNYKGGEYAFMALLPSEGTELADYVAGIDGEKLSKLWSSASGEAYVSIPKFSFDYDNDLSDELSAMGMPVAFTDSADFSNMSETDRLFISSVIHKTHIDVDRDGTKAAAATAVEMKCAGVMEIDENRKEVYLDRPFAYAIIDTESGTPIFIGAVNTVK